MNTDPDQRPADQDLRDNLTGDRAGGDPRCRLARRGTAAAPVVAWSFFTSAPLAGLGLSRESGCVLAWDTSRTIYLLDAAGEAIATWVAAERIATATLSEAGNAVAVLTERGSLWWLDGQLTGAVRHGIVRNPSALAIDLHGQYALVSSQLPPRSAARSMMSEPGVIRATISAVMRTGERRPGTAAVVMTTSLLATASASSSR